MEGTIAEHSQVDIMSHDTTAAMSRYNVDLYHQYCQRQ